MRNIIIKIGEKISYGFGFGIGMGLAFKVISVEKVKNSKDEEKLSKCKNLKKT